MNLVWCCDWENMWLLVHDNDMNEPVLPLMLLTHGGGEGAKEETQEPESSGRFLRVKSDPKPLMYAFIHFEKIHLS